MIRTLSRRAVLGGAGGIAIGLPALEAMNIRPALGAAAPGIGPNGFPKRLILMYTKAGFARNQWTVGATETNFTIGPVLDPLAPHKQDVMLVTGIDNLVHRNTKYGIDHPKGCGTMWTARALVPPGGVMSGQCENCYSGYPSVDQVIAAQVSQGLRFKSLEVGVMPIPAADLDWVNVFGSSGQPLAPEHSPYKVFSRVFQNLGVDGADSQRVRDQRKSILDRVMPRYAALSARLGLADRQKVDAHLDSIRDVESRLFAKGAIKGDLCASPSLTANLDPNFFPNVPAIAKMQMDLLVMAMTCDLTRVATFALRPDSGSGTKGYGWIGISEDHHGLSHRGDSDADAQAKLAKIDRWHAGQLAYLVNALKSVREGTGTLLDNTVICWQSEVAKGNNHDPMDHIAMMAGRAGGYFRPGRWINAKRTGGSPSQSNLLVSLMNAMGLPVTTFGIPDYCTGPLAGLT